MRLIDADALIEMMKDVGSSTADELIANAFWFAVLKSESLTPTIGAWISVKDRLPNDSKPVYVWLGRGSERRSGIPFVGKYDPFGSGAWWIWGLDGDRRDNIKITHWMPLPEGPKEEENDG